MKYFFLTAGWTYNRIWERGGLWNEVAWRRKPHIRCLPLGIVENNETLWLYEVEDAVIMVEVIPLSESVKLDRNIKQVVLKRLMNPQQVIETLVKAQKVVKPG
ncbi:MAG: hypothetical protein NZ901_09335 [Geminocystis sp.]|nr:hypothetical protein [Geminocystis sp.]HIK38899.1 hypothetical protein [Geminocystis sp. M7585_C2015_104]MCS7148377.1 hypothetical protein [Geminocystis sp.]MCX8078309.1 hypothetical protein [Geminocystis sp.]MDW8116035.1 hypothetical protein [Geminocystis sp.]